MSTLVLSPMLIAPLAGLLLLAGEWTLRGSNRTAAKVLIGIGLTLIAVCTLALAAVSFSDRLLGPAADEILPGIYLFTAIYLGVCLILLNRRLMNGPRHNSQGEMSYGINGIAIAVVLCPLAFMSGYLLIIPLTILSGFLLAVRWRQLRRSGLLSLLSGVANVERPFRDVFKVGGQRRGWRQRMNNFAYSLDSGLPLADAGEIANVLDPQSVAIIRAAELTDAVERELPRIAHSADRRSRGLLQDNVFTSTTVYLQWLTIITLLIIGFVMIFIIPKFKVIFEDFGFELPGPTTGMIAAADSFTNNAPLWITGFALWIAAILACVYVSLCGTSRLPQWILELGPKRWTSPTVLRVVAVFIESSCSLTKPLAEMSNAATTSFWRHRWKRLSEVAAIDGEIANVLLETGDVAERQVAGLHAAARIGPNAHVSMAAVMRSIADSIELQSSKRFTTCASWLTLGLFFVITLATLWIAVSVFACLISVINGLS